MGWGSVVGAVVGGLSSLNKSKQKDKVKSAPLWNTWQKSIAPFLNPYLMRGTELPVDPGQTALSTASLTAMEQFAQNMYGGGAGADRGMKGQGEDALKHVLAQGPTNVEDFYKTNIEHPMLESFKQDIMPAISREYTPSGFWSSERTRTEERSREDLLDALVQAKAGLEYKSREDNLNRLLQASGMARDFSTRDLTELATLFGAGEQQYGREKAVLDEQQRREEVRNRAILAALGLSTQENIAFTGGGQGNILPYALGSLGEAFDQTKWGKSLNK